MDINSKDILMERDKHGLSLREAHKRVFHKKLQEMLTNCRTKEDCIEVMKEMLIFITKFE